MKRPNVVFDEINSKEERNRCAKRVCSAWPLKKLWLSHREDTASLSRDTEAEIMVCFNGEPQRMFIQESFIVRFTERKMQYVTAKHKMLCKHSTQRRPRPQSRPAHSIESARWGEAGRQRKEPADPNREIRVQALCLIMQDESLFLSFLYLTFHVYICVCRCVSSFDAYVKFQIKNLLLSFSVFCIHLAHHGFPHHGWIETWRLHCSITQSWVCRLFSLTNFSRLMLLMHLPKKEKTSGAQITWWAFLCKTQWVFHNFNQRQCDEFEWFWFQS